jgi:hypothetical protein
MTFLKTDAICELISQQDQFLNSGQEHRTNVYECAQQSQSLQNSLYNLGMFDSDSNSALDVLSDDAIKSQMLLMAAKRAYLVWY